MHYRRFNVLEAGLDKECSHEGKGLIDKVRAFSSTDFETPLEFIDYVRVPPGTSIGLHRHGESEEVYFVIEGAGEMTENGETFTVRKGDIVVNPKFGSHGLSNNTKEEILLLIFEVRGIGKDEV